VIDRLLDAKGNLLEAADPRVACQECSVSIEPPLPSTIEAAKKPDGADASSNLVPQQSDDSNNAFGSITPNIAGVTRLSDSGQNQIAKPHRLAPRVISAANAYIMTDIMRDVIRRGTARRALSLKRDDIAGKTGTTNDRRDTWFTGFNADIVAGAWVGFDQERSLGAGEEGGHTALPMWVYFMGEALAHRPLHRLPQPEDVVSARVSPTSGTLTGPNDPDGLFELFFAGHLPGIGGLSRDGLPTSGNQRSTTGEDPIF
jgi:penicillin-binding protein 1A